MVENGAGGVSKQRRQQQSPEGSANAVSGFEIEHGCLLHIDQLSADVQLQGQTAFSCRIIILQEGHLAGGLDSGLLVNLQRGSASMLVFCYDGGPGEQPDSTFIGIDMQLNWLSRQVVKNEVPEGSLFDRVLSGIPLTHVDQQAAVSYADIIDLVDQLRDGETRIKYFLLKYYFYNVIVRCIGRMLLDKSHFPRSDLDFPSGERKIRKALAVMDQSLRQKFPGVHELAFISGMSVTSFLEKFQAMLQETPFEYFRRKQMAFALSLLRRGQSVKSVAYNLGYQDPANFSRAFKKFYGKTPKYYAP
ncbi:helix-turn-helix domain-containing protein [Parapedobacter lycopersici]|uniref:helix-turn-helix domain-containing protein n=1 Tax=Parapedobacter lycopersici TaxID=1864939 RepID=UPI00214DAD54|nr:AraC family transcriptional regulator [Parapedobacter lycopersici]